MGRGTGWTSYITRHATHGCRFRGKRKGCTMSAESPGYHAAILKETGVDRDGALRAVVRLARQDDALSDFSEDHLFRELRSREAHGSTGLGDGIAIPHCHLPNLSHFVVGVVTVPAGAEFGSSDGRPVKVFFFIFAPDERRNEHISLLASVSRFLGQKGSVKELIDCRSDEELLACLGRKWSPPQHSSANMPKGLMQIFVQREELMEPILEMLSESVEGEVSVVEGRSARTYLNRLPLFSGFWTDTEEGFLRIITVLAASSKCNDIARKLMLILGDESRRGVLVIVQDIRFSAGGLEF